MLCVSDISPVAPVKFEPAVGGINVDDYGESIVGTCLRCDLVERGGRSGFVI